LNDIIVLDPNATMPVLGVAIHAGGGTPKLTSISMLWKIRLTRMPIRCRHLPMMLQ